MGIRLRAFVFATRLRGVNKALRKFQPVPEVGCGLEGQFVEHGHVLGMLVLPVPHREKHHLRYQFRQAPQAKPALCTWLSPRGVGTKQNAIGTSVEWVTAGKATGL